MRYAENTDSFQALRDRFGEKVKKGTQAGSTGWGRTLEYGRLQEHEKHSYRLK